MPKSQIIISIFLSSPGDVADQRDQAESIVKELNISTARHLGAHLELITWEDYAQPGLGVDAQEVINRSTPQDYDIFLGIMGTRFGTPTGRAGSGTEEEFLLAKERHDADPSSVAFLMYFKDAPIVPSSIDPAQLAKVSEFRCSLSKHALYFDFKDAETFGKLARIHLSTEIHRLMKGSLEKEVADSDQVHGVAVEAFTAVDADEEDLGYLDYILDYQEELKIFTEKAEMVGGATESLGEYLRAATPALQSSTASGDASAIAATLRGVASRMREFSDLAEAESPVFISAFHRSMSSITRAIALAAAEGNIDESQLIENLTSAGQLRQTLVEAIASTAEFRDITEATPRTIKEFNQQKRRLVSVLNYQIEELEKGVPLVAEIERTVRELLAGKK